MQKYGQKNHVSVLGFIIIIIITIIRILEKKRRCKVPWPRAVTRYLVVCMISNYLIIIIIIIIAIIVTIMMMIVIILIIR